MSWLGIGRGIMKTVEGIIEGDGEKILRGVVGTSCSTAGQVAKMAISEEIGQALSERGEKMTEDA